MIYALAALMVSDVRYFSFKDIQLHRRQPFPVLLALIFVAMLTVGAPEVLLFLGVTAMRSRAPCRRWCVPSAAGADRRRRSHAHRAVLDKPGSLG